MRIVRLPLAALALTLFTTAATSAAKPAAKPATEAPKPRLSAEALAGLELRNIGPALMSGRIADVALDPRNESVWYVAVGSGGVWKTTNNGTTWKPIFDGQGSYSIGCVTVDPSHPDIVWVGTGENVGGRHVGFGDGIYRSADGGAHWTKSGLENSQHISKIVVHPTNSDIVWAAAQGPLWSPGGDRGLYKTTDGGKSWKKVLGGGEWTGVTDVAIDPRDPDTLYAATWQHQRTIAAYVGGGPESGVHRSTDGGETWTKLGGGLPEGNLGKIGLAVSPQRPDVVYAAIELDRRTGGFWRSADRGASWEKRSDTVSGATGPHYYQELFASPHAFDRVYLADVRIQVTDDGGKTFRRLQEDSKHSDNHVIVFRPDDPNYLLVGCDGGLYESFDLAANWRFVDNLPITQFYKIAVDDDPPFYHVYGGTQDNSTQGGPVKTDTENGIRNADWFITLFADGYQPATEPGNPDILYSEWQNGNLVRYDRKTGEIVYISPQPEPGDAPERFNWDAPILVSPHSPQRLYYASQRVWRSDDRGDSWRPISGDLSRDIDRLQMTYMGRKWGWDAPWDLDAMSNFGTITSLAESPKQDGLIYAGTDDGLIQVTEDGGATWRKIEVGAIPGVPANAFVNDIKADLFDASTVYVALDDHKSGNFKPYLVKSADRGRSWKSISGDLPDRRLVWRVVQDHVQPNLLFAGTEFGLYFTVDGGQKWIELTGNAPTIPYRDLQIQRHENDLVAGSFGRGIWVLDDYTPLRQVSESSLGAESILFRPRDAWWYVEKRPLGGDGAADQGAGYFVAPNPPYGAVFTYYLADGLKTLEGARQEREKPLAKEGKDTPFPAWEALEAERRQPKPEIVLLVRDASGRLVRRVSGPTAKGMHRVAWDLREAATDSLTAPPTPGGGDGFGPPRGARVAPGSFTVTLAKLVDGQLTELGAPQPFEVRQLRQGTLPGAGADAVAAFSRRLEGFNRVFSAASDAFDLAAARVDLLAAAAERSRADAALLGELHAVRQQLYDLEVALRGQPAKSEVATPETPSIGGRFQVAQIGIAFSTYGPTPTHQRSLEIAEQQLAAWKPRLAKLVTETIPALEAKLAAAGAPWTPGQPIP